LVKDVNSRFKIIDILKNKESVLKDLSERNEKKKMNENEKKQKIINNIDYENKFNFLQLLRINLLEPKCLEYFKDFLELFNKNLLVLLKIIIKLKKDIYIEILNINENKLNVQNNSKINKRNEVLSLINGTKINVNRYKDKENKIIIQKIKILMDEFYKLRNSYDKKFDAKVLQIQKYITNLLLQLK